jgi:hypothetical protein
MEDPTINYTILSHNYLLNFMLLHLENLILFLTQQINTSSFKILILPPLGLWRPVRRHHSPSPHPPHLQLYASDCKKSVQSTTCYSWTAFSLRTAKRPPLPDFNGTWFQLAEHQCCVEEEFTNHSSIPFINSVQYVRPKGSIVSARSTSNPYKPNTRFLRSWGWTRKARNM